MSSQRIHNQPVWLLHHRPFRDSSRILDLLSRDHGRLSVVARGARSAKSRLKGILRPFLPLSVSWVSRSDLGTLTGAELHGAPLSLGGDALLSAYYINELLLKLMHRHDPQPEIFAAYGRTVSRLAGVSDPAALLREFEIELLGLLGYALNLEHDGLQQQDLEADRLYEYRAEQGAMPVQQGGGTMTFSGRELAGIRCQEFADPAVLRAAGRLLRGVIAYHLDGKELQSRKVLRDLRKRPAGSTLPPEMKEMHD
jgi:DNA repair protein RecO (recombination protein O)